MLATIAHTSLAIQCSSKEPPTERATVDKQSGEICPLAFHVRHQLIEALAASNVQTTSSVIRVFLNNFHIVRRSVLTDHLQLIFRRILLVLSRHSHVLPCSHGKRGLWTY